MSAATFTQTRSQALNLENQTEALLSRYSKFQSIHNSIGPEEEESELHETIKDILEKRNAVLNKLNRISETDLNISTSRMQQLQRHRETLNEHKKSFSKIQGIIEEERNKNNLLFSVRSDIKAHKNKSTVSEPNNLNANDYALDERVRADNANSLADRLLQQAYHTRDELLDQRQYLNNASSRMMSTLQTVPGIGVLISKINTRRKRDTIILATVIAICIILLVY